MKAKTKTRRHSKEWRALKDIEAALEGARWGGNIAMSDAISKVRGVLREVLQQKGAAR